MAFNSKQYYDSLTKPTYTDPETGKTYVGKLLSVQQFGPLYERLTGLASLSLDDQLILCADVLKCVFPRKWYQVWKPNVARMVLNSPILFPVIADFFVSQAAAMGMAPPTTTEPPTSTPD